MMISVILCLPAIWGSCGGTVLERLQHVSDAEGAIAMFMLLISVGVMVRNLAAYPEQRITTDALVNRLLLLEPRNFLYKFASDSSSSDRCKTAKSLMLPHKDSSELPCLSSEKWRLNNEKYGLDMKKATFADYFWKRYGRRIHHTSSLLIPAYSLRKYRDHCPFKKISCSDDEYLFLVPEFLRVLPMPRDVLYVGDLIGHFMPPLERTIQLGWACHALEHAAKKVQFGINNARFCRSIPIPTGRHFPENGLAALMNEATTIAPFVLYERLEFLGDAVLGFFLALNVFARNATLAWDCDDCCEIHSFAGKNVTLYNAALRIGIPRLLETGSRPWRSAHVPKAQAGAANSTNNSIATVLDLEPSCPTAKIADSTIGDVVESILAAAYLAGRSQNDDETGGRFVVAILEKLCLPMPQMADVDQRDWFRARGPCLTGGYPFEFDRQWQEQLVLLGTTLYLEHTVIEKLTGGWEHLISVLQNKHLNEDMRKALDHQRSKILLLCALFDDSLNSDAIDSENTLSRMNSSFSQSSRTDSSSDHDEATGNESPVDGLFQVALARDSLYCIGAFAFQLSITQELFYRYPDATPGDLHILRGCALADDVVVYIMIKAGVHKTLFDDNAPAVKQLQTKMLVADILGEKLWQERGGWVVGDREEFRRRCVAFGCTTDRHPNPKYPGIGGGRLHGTKAKLPEKLTGDLVFSFKAIIGALVLSLGLEGMWLCLGPMFEEAMLLSPEELRNEYGDDATGLCAGKRGRKNRKTKQLKYGVLE
jgi:dsRNA-specific ribonuclease